MGITVKKGSVTTTTYSISGDTLADIWADIQKNGPKPRGEVRAGDTLGGISMDQSTARIECTFTEAGGEFEAEAKMTKGTLKYNGAITIPKLKSDKKLSKDAKAEWARYMKELVAHENEHVADFAKVAAAVAKEIDALTANGKGADKKTANDEAISAYTQVFTTTYSKDELDKRVQASADALDSTGHGPKLKTSIK